jgi:5-(carboxyamino)imidazole ribonucleotide mutase
VATVAIGKPGAANAGILAAQIVGCSRPAVRAALIKYRSEQRDLVLGQTLT